MTRFRTQRGPSDPVPEAASHQITGRDGRRAHSSFASWRRLLYILQYGFGRSGEYAHGAVLRGKQVLAVATELATKRKIRCRMRAPLGSLSRRRRTSRRTTSCSTCTKARAGGHVSRCRAFKRTIVASRSPLFFRMGSACSQHGCRFWRKRTSNAGKSAVVAHCRTPRQTYSFSSVTLCSAGPLPIRVATLVFVPRNGAGVCVL